MSIVPLLVIYGASQSIGRAIAIARCIMAKRVDSKRFSSAGRLMGPNAKTAAVANQAAVR
jgi:hypothetical protein